MTYQQAIDFLFKQLPAFERQGNEGYKPGLGNAITLDNWLGNPHRHYKCIHVAGTNGKGSVSNLLAATLQQSGLRVGLFTSPHLVDFRERIRVNGKMIDKRTVSRFVERYLKQQPQCRPSFFELTTAMAFEYFKRQEVDYAVIEVGLGGRLDSSNIITPELSVITNISLDHTQFLGHTLREVATEKAGIIKPGIPVVVGQAEQAEVREVFEKTALNNRSPLVVAQDSPKIKSYCHNNDGTLLLNSSIGNITCQLSGDYQPLNAETALHAIDILRQQGAKIDDIDIKEAFKNVCALTGFMGRWTIIKHNPLVVLDAGHNAGAWRMQASQLAGIKCHRLHMVLGFAADKDVEQILKLMAHLNACYYFTQAQSPRSLKARDLRTMAARHGLEGKAYNTVAAAYAAATEAAGTDDCIFVGGSFYVLGELLPSITK